MHPSALSPTLPLSRRPAHGTLALVDAADAELADRLLQQRLKARLFGEAATDDPVRIGAYTLERRLGAGGMGTVWLGHDPELERHVAIKVMHTERSETGAQILGEARALARLTHPNVVSVHEVGEHDGRLFVAMEYVDGETLTQWLARHPVRPPGRWQRLTACAMNATNLRAVVARFVDAARGLHAAHAAGLVHRDFKPDNVLVGRDGRVRVVDFGIASPVQAASDELAVTDAIDCPLRTRTGEVVGTPAYMAPEQFAGERVDARADQFALCVALYEAVCGERPFAGASVPALRRAVVEGAARPAPRWVPARLRAALARGLARAPARRFPDMAALVAALERGAPRRASAWVALAATVVPLALLVVLSDGREKPSAQAPADTGGPGLMTRLWHALPATCAPPPAYVGSREALMGEARGLAERLALLPEGGMPHIDAKLELMGLMLSAGQTSACKLVADTRAKEWPLTTRQASALACLERLHCAPLPVTCPPNFKNDGPDGCEPAGRCAASGTEAQVAACAAGDAGCCANALIVGEYMDREANVADSEASLARRRTLARTGCELGYAWLCVEASGLGAVDVAAMRARACGLGHRASCEPEATK